MSPFENVVMLFLTLLQHTAHTFSKWRTSATLSKTAAS